MPSDLAVCEAEILSSLPVGTITASLSAQANDPWTARAIHDPRLDVLDMGLYVLSGGKYARVLLLGFENETRSAYVFFEGDELVSEIQPDDRINPDQADAQDQRRR